MDQDKWQNNAWERSIPKPMEVVVHKCRFGAGRKTVAACLERFPNERNLTVNRVRVGHA